MEPELLEHLRVEFGSQGERAVEFFETARQHLEDPLSSKYRVGETVAYCCREALISITATADSVSPSPWRELSRNVVAAHGRYKLALEMHGEDLEAHLDDLSRCVSELRQFHEDGESHHRKRLIAVVVERAGVPPLSGSQVVETFENLLDRLNTALHGHCGLVEAGEMWSACVALVTKIFLPAPVRSDRLNRLAKISEPSTVDVQELQELLATPFHLRQFVRQLKTPGWLKRLNEAGLFQDELIGAWPAVGDVSAQLLHDFPQEVCEWLSDLLNRSLGDPLRLRYIASAAQRGAEPGRQFLYEMLKCHQGIKPVVIESMRAAVDLDPSDAMTTRFADLLFNPWNWQYLYVPDQLADSFVVGANEHNCRERLELLCFKLKSTDPDDYTLMKLRGDLTGSVADLEKPRLQERVPVLVSCLVSLLEKTWAWLAVSDVLDLLATLPEGLAERTRAWVLSQAPDVEVESLVSEIEDAVRNRYPTSDSLGMLDRALNMAVTETALKRWRGALGEAPPIDETERATAGDETRAEWNRKAMWAKLLPQNAVGSWGHAAKLLSPEPAADLREWLTQRRKVMAETSTSPFSSEELGALPPPQACEKIAAWRPRVHDWEHDPRQLGQMLRTIVHDNPAQWLQHPLDLVTRLRHPTYIGSYLRAVEANAAHYPDQAGALVDVVQFVHRQPWPAEVLSDERLDYDSDWNEAKRAGIDVIRAIVNADIDLGERADEVWSLIESAARDRSEASPFLSEVDPRARAINRSCTRAFQTALMFVDSEQRASRPIRTEFVDLLDFALRIEGADGAEYRAIIAPYLAWFRQVLPEWTDDNIGLLLGEAAPANLAQITIDLAISWARPDSWLLENFRELVKTSVLRGTKMAVNHLMVAMLWECTGYNVEDVATFIEQHKDQHPELPTRIGERLSYIVNEENTEERYVEIATRLWESLLDSRAASVLGGFGWMHQCSVLDEERWAQLTLRTLKATTERGFWARGTIERAMTTPATVTKLAVLNALVRSDIEPWDMYHIADNVNNLLLEASFLRETEEYKRLVTALQERDMIRDDPEEAT